MSTIIVGVDPGMSGAVCRLDSGVPTVLRDFKTLRDIAYSIQELSPGASHAVVELVHAMPGQGVCSMFSFGRAAGVMDGALALCLPSLVVESVTPQKWQNFFRALFEIPREQEFDSRALAVKLFPDQAALFKRKKDHNSADATLLCVWKAHQLAKQAVIP